MSIIFKCRACGQKSKAPEDYAGKHVRCPNCGVPTDVPADQVPYRNDSSPPLPQNQDGKTKPVMPESFDAYHKWLGIPPEDQPPNHYRLLGIRRFESDPDVIKAAADRVVGDLQDYHTGQHAELSKRLLDEVDAAWVCLLDFGKKAAYDEKLKLQEESQIAPPASPLGIAPSAQESYDRLLQRSQSETPPPVPHRSTSEVRKKAESVRTNVTDRLSKPATATPAGTQTTTAGGEDNSRAMTEGGATASLEPQGVDGWLLFFCLNLTMLSPFFACLQYFLVWMCIPYVFESDPSTKLALILLVFGDVIIVVYGFDVGCVIWSGSPTGRRDAKGYLVFRLCCGVGIGLIAGILYLMGGAPTEEVWGDVFNGAIVPEAAFFVIWWLYFQKSKRVANTYGPEKKRITATAPETGKRKHSNTIAGQKKQEGKRSTAMSPENKPEANDKQCPTDKQHPTTAAVQKKQDGKPLTRISRESELEALLQRRINREKPIFERRLTILDPGDNKHGRRYAIPGIGIIDFLTIDLDTNEIVVVEVEKDEQGQDIVGQLAKYMAWVRVNLAAEGQEVRGIICVWESTDWLRQIVPGMPDVEMFEYDLNFTKS